MFKSAAATGKILVRLSPALAFFACGGDDPQVPTTLAPVTSAQVTGIVGSVLATNPSVTIKDQKGKGIGNMWVKWTANSGKVQNDSSKTDVNGTATPGTWTLGTVAGAQTLTAQAGQLPPLAITADAKAGPVAALIVQTQTTTGVVGSDVVVPPAVKAVDAYSNAVANAPVVFAVSAGAGSITGANQTSNANGIATVGSWKLGTLAGTQSLRADVISTGTTATMNAVALSAPASQLVMIDGNGQVGQANKRLCTSPVIAVRDEYGNGVGQVPIVFTPGANSGTVTGGQVLSKADNGYAVVTAWNLSNSAAQTLVVTSPSVPGKSLTFTATIGPSANFSICARFLEGAGTPRQREAVAKAVSRWQRVISAHLETSILRANGNQCLAGIGQLDEVVEDLLLYVHFGAIDGPNNIIGEATPCYIHSTSGLTAMGYLRLDAADLIGMENNGTLDNVVLHEIGHIIGVGTLWNYRGRALLSGFSPGLDPIFTGAAARDQFAQLFGTYTGSPVPVENCVGISGCGAGTRDAHWRKSVFGTELMQGYAAPTMKMSAVTVGSLADLGYTVDLTGADALTGIAALRSSADSFANPLINDVADAPLWQLQKDGSSVLVRPARNPLKKY